MMKKEALIIFVRKPELGKVKTRLAAAIGDEAALAIYKKLLEHTHSVTAALHCDKFVFYVDVIEEDDLWSTGYTKLLQAKTDLGGRMKAAFSYLFENGYSRICIIGSDCYELSSEIILEAFELLDKNDVVIGPAKDGGYYLLGMRDNLKTVFAGVEWSTEKVFSQTLEKIKQQQCTHALLPVLTDVDTVDDVPQALLSALL